MPIILRLALLADLGSIWLEVCFPGLAHLGVFTSDHVARLMILLLGAAILIELLDIAKKASRKDRADHPRGGSERKDQP